MASSNDTTARDCSDDEYLLGGDPQASSVVIDPGGSARRSLATSTDVSSKDHLGSLARPRRQSA